MQRKQEWGAIQDDEITRETFSTFIHIVREEGYAHEKRAAQGGQLSMEFMIYSEIDQLSATTHCDESCS